MFLLFIQMGEGTRMNAHTKQTLKASVTQKDNVRIKQTLALSILSFINAIWSRSLKKKNQCELKSIQPPEMYNLN